MLQAHFEEKNVPFKCRVCGVCKLTRGALCTHYMKNHWSQVDLPVGTRISMSAQDSMPRHFVQASIAEVEAGICLDAPSDEKVGADVLGHLGIHGPASQ